MLEVQGDTVLDVGSTSPGRMTSTSDGELNLAGECGGLDAGDDGGYILGVGGQDDAGWLELVLKGGEIRIGTGCKVWASREKDLPGELDG